MLATVHMKKVIVRSNREYDYFDNVLEYEYDYFASYSSTRTQKVLVLEYEYEYKSTITPSLEHTRHVSTLDDALVILEGLRGLVIAIVS